MIAGLLGELEIDLVAMLLEVTLVADQGGGVLPASRVGRRLKDGVSVEMVPLAAPVAQPPAV